MGSLFKNSDLKTGAVAGSVPDEKPAEALPFDSEAVFTAACELKTIRKHVGELKHGRSVWYITKGAWSAYDLVEYLLQLSGPAEVCISTWAINETAINKFSAWQKQGLITQFNGLIDVGLRTKKPAIFQSAMAAFPKLKIAHCHAKLIVVRNATHHIAVVGSANQTKNPRIESGTIIWDKEIAGAVEAWILKEVNS